MTPDQKQLLRDALVATLAMAGDLGCNLATLRNAAKAAGFVVGENEAMLHLTYITGKGYAENLVIYGEIFGDVQDLKYDHIPGRQSLRVFAIRDLDTGRLMDWESVVAFCQVLGLQTVPVLYKGPYDFDLVSGLVEGKSTLAPTQMREGVVISLRDQQDIRFKWVSQTYKLRKTGTEFH